MLLGYRRAFSTPQPTKAQRLSNIPHLQTEILSVFLPKGFYAQQRVQQSEMMLGGKKKKKVRTIQIENRSPKLPQ